VSPFGNKPSVEKLIEDASVGAIEADRIRDILFGGDAPAGLHLEGAKIFGPLNLKDARGPNGRDCDPLILTNCQISGDKRGPAFPSIDGSYGKFARIELVDCGIDGINLSGAVIAGDLVLDSLHTQNKQPARPACWVLARGIRVDGAISAREAKLRLPWTPRTVWKPEGATWRGIPTPFALDLRNARIGTWLMLTPGFDADGGVNIGGATIGGELWLNGAHLRASRLGSFGPEPGVEALFAQRAVIDGFAQFGSDLHGRRFSATGTVQFREAVIKGSLDIRGAVISGHRYTKAKNPNTPTLPPEGVELLSASIGGDFYFTDDVSTNRVPGRARSPIINLGGVRLGGDLYVDVAAPTTPTGSNDTGHVGRRPARRGTALSINEIKAQGITVGGDATLEGSIGTLNLSNAVVGRGLDIKTGGWIYLPGARIAGSVSVSDGRSGPIRTLEAPSLKVGRDLQLGGHLSGTADLQSAFVEGNLHLGEWEDPNSRHTTESPTDGPRALGLRGSEGGEPSLILLNEAVIRLGLHVNAVEYPRFIGDVSYGNIRTTALTVFPGWRLGQARVKPLDGAASGVLSFLYRDQRPYRRDEEQRLQSVVVLDGYSSRLYDRETLGLPQLDTPEHVDEYLALFCAYVWGEDGAFEIVDPELFPGPTSALGTSLTPVSTPARVAKHWVATKNVRYGEAVYRATFKVQTGGTVRMTNDEPLRAQLPEAAQWGRPSKPLRLLSDDAMREFEKAPPPLRSWPRKHLPWSLGSWVRWRTPWSPWQIADKGEHDRLWPAVQEKVEPTINLEGLEVGALDDDDGRKWKDGLRLELAGFAYRRLHTNQANKPGVEELVANADKERDAKTTFDLEASPKGAPSKEAPAASKSTNHVKDRENWLARGKVFRPGPYEQLAKLWRSEGRYADADHVTYTRLERERLSKDGGPVGGIARVLVFLGFVALMTMLGAIIWGPWGLGATMGSIVVTLAATFWLLLLPSRLLKLLLLAWPFGYGLKVSRAAGFVFVLWVVGGVLAFAGTSSVNGHAALKIDTSSIGTVAGLSPNYPGAVLPVVTETGTTGKDELDCVGQIDPMLYALDVMVPLLDLRQEQRCRPSAEPGAWFLRYLKVVYAVLGWIAISGLVLTGSGVVRRQIEG
jgi:hypothetical protein